MTNLHTVLVLMLLLFASCDAQLVQEGALADRDSSSIYKRYRTVTDTGKLRSPPQPPQMLPNAKMPSVDVSKVTNTLRNIADGNHVLPLNTGIYECKCPGFAQIVLDELVRDFKSKYATALDSSLFLDEQDLLLIEDLGDIRHTPHQLLRQIDEYCINRASSLSRGVSINAYNLRKAIDEASDPDSRVDLITNN